MSDKMSTQYMLALMSDKIKDVETLLNKLKVQDNEHANWDDKTFDSLEEDLAWLKEKANMRLEQLMQEKAAAEAAESFEAVAG